MKNAHLSSNVHLRAFQSGGWRRREKDRKNTRERPRLTGLRKSYYAVSQQVALNAPNASRLIGGHDLHPTYPHARG